MRNISDYIKGLVTGLAISIVLMSFTVFAWKWLYPIPYPAPPKINSTTALPATLEELSQRVQALENDQAYNLRNFEWQIDQKILVLGSIALTVTVITGFLGIKTYNDLDKVIKEKIRTTLENQLYQLDPVNLTVRIPKHHPDNEKIQKRLAAAGLKNIKEYTELSNNCKVGLTIVPIESTEQEEPYISFLENEAPSSDEAAFVLYSSKDPREYRIPSDVINKHVRAATANMPSTVVTAILAISRGLHKDKAIPSEKEAS